MSQASWFMKPTINTSPLTWSCTTAGINPSSFVKSISLYNKKPRHSYRRGLHCVREKLLVLVLRAVLPAGRCGHDDGGRARESEPWKVEAYQMACSPATAATAFTLLRRQTLLITASTNTAAVTGYRQRQTGQRMSDGNGDDPRYAA